MERQELMAWADAVVRNTKSHAAHIGAVMSHREKGFHKQEMTSKKKFKPQTVTGAAAEMLAQLCASLFHGGLLLAFSLAG